GPRDRGRRYRRGGARRGGRCGRPPRDRDRRGRTRGLPMSALRIAVIGAGVMGGHHARKVYDRAAREGDVVLAGIADTDAERARAIAREPGVPPVAAQPEPFAAAGPAVVAPA